MKLRWFLVLVAALPALISCSLPAGRLPPSAKTYSPTPEGLAALFKAECIDQADLDWVKRRWDWERERRCGWGWWDDGDDCVANFDGSLITKIPSEAGRLTALIYWTWRPQGGPDAAPAGPPHGHLSCGVAVAEAEGPALQAAARSINGTMPPIQQETDPGWYGIPSRLTLDQPTPFPGQRLVLIHYSGVRDRLEDMQKRFDEARKNNFVTAKPGEFVELSNLQEGARRPWVLSVARR